MVVLSPPGSTRASRPSRSFSRSTGTASAPARSIARAWASTSPWTARMPTRRRARRHAARSARRRRTGPASKRYQPRFARRSCSASVSISMPGIASPRPREAFEHLGRLAPVGGRVHDRAGALRRVGALEDARADEDGLGAERHAERRVGRRGDAARREVRHRQAARLGDLAHQLDRRAQLLGRGRQLLGPERAVRRRIAPMTLRRWRTASTMLPLPASPLVRIIAAPSPIRRSASPRSRAPHTKGERKSCFQTWCSSSAGVSTSLSSMKSTPRASSTRASTKWPIRTFAITGIETVRWMPSITAIAAHARHAALAADVGGHPLEGHHRGGAGVLGDLRLLGRGHVHDHAALQHLGEADLQLEGLGARAAAAVAVAGLLRLLVLHRFLLPRELAREFLKFEARPLR